MNVPDDLRAKAMIVHDRLCAAYGCPIAFFHELDPLSELVSSLLSHRTKNRDSGRAFRQLRARFGTWDAVRDAPTAEVEEAISPVTWPEQKAPRIQEILRRIGELRGGELSLEFLAELPVRQARDWLEGLPNEYAQGAQAGPVSGKSVSVDVVSACGVFSSGFFSVAVSKNAGVSNHTATVGRVWEFP